MRSGAYQELSLLELEQKRADGINRQSGTETGYDCKSCRNRGYFARVKDRNGSICRVMEECRCMEVRRSMARMKYSGLETLLKRHSFDNFKTPEQWQKEAKKLAKEYTANHQARWFMICGRPGTGKTHLCTAICKALLEQGRGIRYVLWRDMAVQAKALVNDDGEYQKIVAPLKRADVLYIDDFFKAGRTEGGNMKVSVADVNLAFEIISARYNQANKLTIISSEKNIGDVLNDDEAVGSRIYERTKEFYVPIRNAENWRLKN